MTVLYQLHRFLLWIALHLPRVLSCTFARKLAVRFLGYADRDDWNYFGSHTISRDLEGRWYGVEYLGCGKDGSGWFGGGSWNPVDAYVSRCMVEKEIPWVEAEERDEDAAKPDPHDPANWSPAMGEEGFDW